MRSNEYVVSEWTEMPYTSHDRRGAVIEHRVVLEPYDNNAADVRHEVRSDDERAKTSDRWTPIRVYELRSGRVTQLDRGEVLRS